MSAAHWRISPGLAVGVGGQGEGMAEGNFPGKEAEAGRAHRRSRGRDKRVTGRCSAQDRCSWGQKGDRTRHQVWTRHEHESSISKEDSDATLSYMIYDTVLVYHNYILCQYYLCDINNKWYNFSDSDTMFNDRIWNYTSWAQSNMYSLVIILIKKIVCIYMQKLRNNSTWLLQWFFNVVRGWAFFTFSFIF